MDLREIGWGGIDWIHMIQDRGPACEHGNESSDSIKCCKILSTAERLVASQEGFSSTEFIS
jgi:hypothetical protein